MAQTETVVLHHNEYFILLTSVYHRERGRLRLALLATWYLPAINELLSFH